MTQSQVDDFDWTVTDQATPSSPTGPDAAYRGAFYVFIETTGRQPGDQARYEHDYVAFTKVYTCT